jgi:hypothetical protein
VPHKSEIGANKVEQSFCNCLLSFSHPFSPLVYFPLLLSNRKWSTQKTTNSDTPTSLDLTPPDDQLESMDAYMLDQ